MVQVNKHIEEMMASQGLHTTIALATAQGVDILADKNNKLVARQLHESLLGLVINDKDNKLMELGMKLVMSGQTVASYPLATAMAQFAIATAKQFEGDDDISFRLSGVVFNLLKQAGLIAEYTKITENGHKERVLVMGKKWELSKEIFIELQHKIGKGARPYQAAKWTPTSKGGYEKTKWIAGSRLNEVLPQTQEIYDVLNHLQATAYAVDWDVWDKFKMSFRASFPAEQSMIEIDKMELELLALGTEPAYFAYNFGANGRVYCEGYRTHRQAGIRNEIFDFHKKSLWNQADFHIVERQIEGLQGATSQKELIQLYKLTRDLAAQRNGIPTGTIIKRDAKMSGVQVAGAIAMRSKADAHYTGCLGDFKIDGRLQLSSQGEMAKYDLNKAEAKAAAMTWMYLSGGKTMLAKMEEDTGKVLDVEGKAFKKEWEDSAKNVFPGQIRLMKELTAIIKYFDKNTHFRWTSASGFNVSIANIKSVEDIIHTVMGKHSFRRETIDTSEVLLGLGAAFGHSGDASMLHWSVQAAKARGVDIDTVHDQFGYHLADSEPGDAEYVSGLQRMFDMPVLESFMQDVAGNGDYAKFVLVNTLERDDIKGGLFD